MAYSPPIGIPNPSAQFGWEIDRPTPDWPSEWNSPSSAKTNFYYVDKTHPSATDSSNTYGHPDLPRATIPEGPVDEGAFIYIHAGTYGVTDSPGPNFNIYGAGTSLNPIWITGNPVTRPIIEDEIHIGYGGSASYIIFEHIEIRGSSGLFIFPTVDGDDVDHILVRNVLKTGTESDGDAGGAIVIGASGATDSIPNSTITDIVVYNCVIRDQGNIDSSDDHGVSGGYHTNRVWILDNLIYHCGGDSVQASHHSNYTDKLTERWYIGRNTCYGNGENGIDLKVVRYAIVSQNTVYGPFAREQGAGIALHYGSTSELRCRDCWVIFNRVHHVSGGIVTSSSDGCDNLNIVGNLIYDVKSSYAALADTLNGYCIFVGGSNGTIRIVDNTFYDYEAGILIEDLTTGDSLQIHGNVFASRNSSEYEIELADTSQDSFVTSNYNHYPVNSRFYWDGALRNFSYLQGLGQEQNSSEGDPEFTNPTANFIPIAGSPIIGASVEGPVGDTAYDAFQTLFSQSILFDHRGAPRPVGGSWDIGALEHDVVTVFKRLGKHLKLKGYSVI